MTETHPEIKLGPNDVLRFVLELFAFVTLGIWGFTAWPIPWPGVLVGIAAPAFAILVWALFRSPKAVFKLDPFGKAIVEIFVFGAAALPGGTWASRSWPASSPSSPPSAASSPAARKSAPEPYCIRPMMAPITVKDTTLYDPLMANSRGLRRSNR